jgi:sirohydrochlorin cobaltochelatase
MKDIIVLAMHGVPPNDFPRDEVAEFVGLMASMEPGGRQHTSLRQRFAELDARMRSWPRTASNDPFSEGAQEIAGHLSRITGCDVIIGYNEFCGPALDEAMEKAAARAPGRIIVLTPMLTRGGEHAEEEIKASVETARKRHPEIPIVYAWPFDPSDVAGFLAAQAERFSK